jgi:bacterioferritin-associated ferredoxin
MYVCICNGHRDQEIRAAAATGLRCAREIYRHLGKPPRCGRCLDLAARVIEEVHAANAETSDLLETGSAA